MTDTLHKERAKALAALKSKTGFTEGVWLKRPTDGSQNSFVKLEASFYPTPRWFVTDMVANGGDLIEESRRPLSPSEAKLLTSDWL